jgi:hypothetical protein
MLEAEVVQLAAMADASTLIAPRSSSALLESRPATAASVYGERTMSGSAYISGRGSRQTTPRGFAQRMRAGGVLV